MSIIGTFELFSPSRAFQCYYTEFEVATSFSSIFILTFFSSRILRALETEWTPCHFRPATTDTLASPGRVHFPRKAKRGNDV
jgi:hypothetical protein